MQNYYTARVRTSQDSADSSATERISSLTHLGNARIGSNHAQTARKRCQSSCKTTARQTITPQKILPNRKRKRAPSLTRPRNASSVSPKLAQNMQKLSETTPTLMRNYSTPNNSTSDSSTATERAPSLTGPRRAQTSPKQAQSMQKLWPDCAKTGAGGGRGRVRGGGCDAGS